MNLPNIPFVPEGALDTAPGTNVAINVLKALVQTNVLTMDQDSPPGSPEDNDMHIVSGTGGTATGDWEGQEKNLARYVSETESWKFYAAGDEVSLVLNRDDGGLYVYSDAAWRLASAGDSVIPIACSDEVTALGIGTAKVTFRMPYGMTLSAVRASLSTAQASGSIFTVDINKNGTTILSTKLTIDNTEKTSTTAATPAVISVSSLTDDSEITIDIDQIGDGTAAGLKVYLIGSRAL